MRLLIYLSLAALILAPIVLISGWIVMICLGALAHIFGAPALAIGYGPSCLVSLILAILVG